MTKTVSTREQANLVPQVSTAIILPKKRLRLKTVFLHSILVFFCLVILLPFIWIFLRSITSIQDFYSSPFLPPHVEWSNYAWVLKHYPAFSRNLINTVAVSTATVSVTTLLSVLAGYALVHLRLPGRVFLITFMVVTLFIPARIMMLIGVFELNSNLHLLNTLIGLVLPYISLNIILGILVMRGVFSQISSELVDAARIDGSSAWHTLWAVLLPLARNGIVVVAMTTFIFSWGEFVLAGTVNDNVNFQPLMLVFLNGISGMGQVFPPQIFALYVVFLAPGILVFAIVQRWFIKGLQEGAFRG